MKTRPIVLVLIMLAAALLLSSCSGGGGSAGAPLTPPPLFGVPAAPTTVYAVASSQTVTISWNSMTYATSYTVLRSSTSPTTGYAPLRSGLISTSCTDTAVSTGNTYFYVVHSKSGLGESGDSAPATATAQDVSGAETLSGTIKYEDKTYSYFGFTGAKSLKAVRYAKVDLVGSDGNTILSTKTSSTGTFSLNVSAYTGTTVYISVVSDASSPAGPVVVNTLAKKPYAVGSTSIPVTAGTAADLGLSILTSNTAGGAFNMLDAYTSSAEFVNSLSLSSVPTVTVYWPNRQSGDLYGTYYCGPVDAGCTNGEGIYVLSDPPASPAYDTDEYDDDVLWHEYAHFIGSHFSKDDSPGGVHAFWVNDYDMRLAWSEGWADFFETAVKSWLKANHPELLSTDLVVPIAQYVDTATVPGWFYISINQSNPELSVQGTDADTDSCLAGECQYAANEIAVANVLWQLMEGNGTNGYGMAPIWNSITDPGFMATSPHVNMESFFDALTSANTPSTADIQAVFASRSIDCAPDSRETDDSFATAGTYTGSQVHTLYSDATATHFDVDYVAFNVTSATVYTVTTSSLRSGAATHLDIFDPDMTLIASGDNAVPFNYNSNCDDFGCHVNGTDTLASSLTFSSPTGTAYVRILSSGSGSVFAGKYGSYILTIKP